MPLLDHDNQDRGRRSGGQKSVTAAEKAQAREVSLGRIGRLFTPHRWPLAIVTAIIVASSVVAMGSPFLLRAVIDTALPRQDLTLLVWLVIGMVAIAAVTSALGVAQTWISTRVGQQVMHRLRTDVFAHLQRQSIGFFTRTRTGEVQSRITNDIGGMSPSSPRRLRRSPPTSPRRSPPPSPWSRCRGSSRSSRSSSCRPPST
jgi:ATP-binding cassette subfamily B protein